MVRIPIPFSQIPDSDKFAEALIYIAEKSEEDSRFGAIKLNKILYYSDFYAYRKLGKSITGVEYQHLEEGPAPRPLLPVRDALVANGSIEMEYRQYYTGVQQRIVAKRPPHLDDFSTDEIKIINEVIDELRPLNALEVTIKSHQEYGWKLTQEGETIPLRTAWLSSEPPSLEQVELGRKIAERYGLSTT